MRWVLYFCTSNSKDSLFGWLKECTCEGYTEKSLVSLKSLVNSLTVGLPHKGLIWWQVGRKMIFVIYVCYVVITYVCAYMFNAVSIKWSYKILKLEINQAKAVASQIQQLPLYIFNKYVCNTGSPDCNVCCLGKKKKTHKTCFLCNDFHSLWCSVHMYKCL